MRSLILIGSIVLSLSSTSAMAAPSAKALDLAERYVAALKLQEQQEAMFRNLIPVMVADMAKRRGIPAAISSELQGITVEVMNETMAEMRPRYMAKMTPVIAETLTEAELEAAVAFYESAVGQQIVAKGPELVTSGAAAMREIMPDMQTKMMQRLFEKLEPLINSTKAPPTTPSF